MPRVTTMSRVYRFTAAAFPSTIEGKGTAIDSRAETAGTAFRVDHLVIALASDERYERRQ